MKESSFNSKTARSGRARCSNPIRRSGSRHGAPSPLIGGLVDLSRRQMTLNAPFNGLGAPCRDPDRRMGLLQRARPDRAVFELKELSFMTPDRLGPRGHDEIIGFFETAAGF